MPDGLAWDDLPIDLATPGATIRRKDFDGLAMCLIRLGAGEKTDELLAGLPDDRCQCAHWGYIVAGTMRVHRGDGARDYVAGETYYWAPTGRPATSSRPSPTPNTSRSQRSRTTTC
jgi:hypothetical protein